MKYKLPYFEEIDLTQLEEEYYVEIEQNGQKIDLDLTFEEEEIETEVLDLIKTVLENIDLEDVKNRTYIAANFKDENERTVQEYLAFHIEELGEQLSEIINFEDQSNSLEKQLMEKLKLDRIGFYPDGEYGEEPFVVFDYVVDKSLSNRILVVNINQEGKLLNLTSES